MECTTIDTILKFNTPRITYEVDAETFKALRTLKDANGHYICLLDADENGFSKNSLFGDKLLRTDKPGLHKRYEFADGSTKTISMVFR